MVDFSLGKLIVLAILILIVWYGFKYVQRVEEIRQSLRREMGRRRGGAPQHPPPLPAEDLVKCERCGAYTASGAACARADCPRRG